MSLAKATILYILFVKSLVAPAPAIATEILCVAKIGAYSAIG
ncbi:MAG: hypothetical protein O9264_10235 [Leptospira sp.]|nr:hypothetical protein [Leptospira sp.]